MIKLNIGDFIIFKKISQSEEPMCPTPSFDDYSAGNLNYGKSLPSGYIIEGYLENIPEVGSSLCIKREKRNGIPVQGQTTTSEITGVTYTEKEVLIRTTNSIYSIIVKNELLKGA